MVIEDLNYVTPVAGQELLPAIKTAAILIIGDEVLNGKIKDTNSYFFSKFCFSQGIELKKIVVIGDEVEDIKESILQLNNKYDLIFTSGGIGSTHDDITYPSIARAFGLELKKDEYLIKRMNHLSNRYKQLTGEEREAELRMVTLPQGNDQIKVANYHLDVQLWVPVVCIIDKIFILPGIPQLFELLTQKLQEHLACRVNQEDFLRFYIMTKVGESEMAPFLKNLQLKNEQLKIGSYPHFAKRVNTISLIGRKREEKTMKSVANHLVEQFDGEFISEEKEATLI